MNSLVSILTRIYIFVFCVSFMLFLVQAFAAPVSTRLAIGIGLHGVLMVFGKFLCEWLVNRYEIAITDAEIFNVATLFLFANIGGAFIFVLLYVFFVPLK